MLKSLELFGFKSFADRTRFDFSTGITCVVGPNGSGKSNVVDALKWILGDQSAKSLRGKEMTDVIFNGSSGRKPSAFAEATLTFDNSQGTLPLDSQEVQIGRRIWRNGDAEYLINRAPARLKDVRDLFMGTGAGSSAYSIIEQGRVDQILQANPSSRRMVFEEAAGISRYKARKTDAQRKLERVGQNLLRLTDIVDEVEAQLNSTRSQAAKAAKFRELSDELRRWWTGLAADDYRHFTAEQAATEQRLEEQGRRIDELNTVQQQIESRQSEFDGEISAIDDRLREVERAGSGNRESAASHEATVQYQTARLQELEAELTRLKRQRVLLATRSKESLLELEKTERQLQVVERDCEKRQDSLSARELQIVECGAGVGEERERIEQARQRHLELTREVSAAESRVRAIETQVEATHSARAKAIGRSTGLDEAIAACRAERDRREAKLARTIEELTAAQEQLRAVQEQRQALVSEQEQCKKQLAAGREQRSGWHARKSVLEDLEKRQEGLGIGVKEILTRAENSHYPPWNQILGSVADLLEVDLEQAALLEVALGNRAQLIVLHDFEPLVDYLNQGACTISGRVGFMAIPDLRNPVREAPPRDARFAHFELKPEALPDLTDCAGVVMRADGLIKASRGGANLPACLLADTWIVQTLETAVELSGTEGKGCRFVTLQGEVFEADGTLYVGTVRSETAIVSRKSELRRLKNDLLRLDRTIAAHEEQLEGVGGRLRELDGRLSAAQAELEQSSEQLGVLRADLAGQELELERLRRERAALAEQAEALERDSARQEEELRHARQSLEDAREQLDAALHSITESEQNLARAMHRLKQLEQDRSAERLELTRQEERLQSLRSGSARLGEEREQRDLQREEAERRLQVAIAKRSQINLQILNTTALLAELALEHEATASDVSGLMRQKNQLRQRRSQVAAEALRVRQERRELSERRHEQEIRLRDIRHQTEVLQQRLEEEYQLSLADLAASEASAFRLWLEERRAERQAREHHDGDESAEQVSPAAREDSSASSPEAEETIGPSASTMHSTEEQIAYADVRDQLEAHVGRLKRKLKLMGSVNTESLENLEELEQRFAHLSSQLQDLVEAKNSLEEIIRRINIESKRLFTETFHTIRGHFQDLFRKLFGGGEGDVVLEDPDDILECGIDIIARPPGKELRSISLLSGGEKTMTAVALLMAIFKSRPSPFCILDEVDAALDEANVERYVNVLKDFRETTQFVMITHHKRSMTAGDVLYGVTMEESGVSKRMSVRFEDVSENGEFRPSAETQARSDAA